MLGFSPKIRFYLYSQPTDMRKGFDGLSGLIRAYASDAVLSGDVFIFVSRSRTHVKFLYWDNDGFALYYKRLERGRFELPVHVANTKNRSGGCSYELRRDEVVLLLEGVRLLQARRQKRYSREVHSDGSAT